MNSLTTKIIYFTSCIIFLLNSLSAEHDYENEPIRMEWVECLNEAETIEEARDAIICLIESLKDQGYDVPDLQKVADLMPGMMKQYGIDYSQADANRIRSIIDGTFTQHLRLDGDFSKDSKNKLPYTKSSVIGGLEIFVGCLIVILPIPGAQVVGSFFISTGAGQLIHDFASGNMFDDGQDTMRAFQQAQDSCNHQTQKTLTQHKQQEKFKENYLKQLEEDKKNKKKKKKKR